MDPSRDEISESFPSYGSAVCPSESQLYIRLDLKRLAWMGKFYTMSEYMQLLLKQLCLQIAGFYTCLQKKKKVINLITKLKTYYKIKSMEICLNVFIYFI